MKTIFFFLVCLFVCYKMKRVHEPTVGSESNKNTRRRGKSRKEETHSVSFSQEPSELPNEINEWNKERVIIVIYPLNGGKFHSWFFSFMLLFTSESRAREVGLCLINLSILHKLILTQFGYVYLWMRRRWGRDTQSYAFTLSFVQKYRVPRTMMAIDWNHPWFYTRTHKQKHCSITN